MAASFALRYGWSAALAIAPYLTHHAVPDVSLDTHLYQRHASCCRYYLLPQGQLCASCPLVSQEERLERNAEWMQKQLDREAAT